MKAKGVGPMTVAMSSQPPLVRDAATSSTSDRPSGCPAARAPRRRGEGIGCRSHFAGSRIRSRKTVGEDARPRRMRAERASRGEARNEGARRRNPPSAGRACSGVCASRENGVADLSSYALQLAAARRPTFSKAQISDPRPGRRHHRTPLRAGNQFRLFCNP